MAPLASPNLNVRIALAVLTLWNGVKAFDRLEIW